MRVDLQARNTEITPRFREHAEPRVSSLDHVFDRISEVRVTLTAQRGWKTVEIMLEADGLMLRSEERSNDELASFDRALDKLERQLKRYRDRMRDHAKRPLREIPVAGAAVEDEARVDEETVEDLAGVRIVRTKTHALRPMTVEDAAMQMDLLGHDFFLFYNSASDRVEVVYRRRDGDYGLIEYVVG
jgi:putative sigma-54 modulation protein